MTQKETQPNDEKRIIAPYKNSTRRQRQTNIADQNLPTNAMPNSAGSTKSRNGNALTDAERDEIIDRYATGQGINQIASEMGRNCYTVIKCLNSNGS